MLTRGWLLCVDEHVFMWLGLRMWMCVKSFQAPVFRLKVHFRRKQENLLSGHQRSQSARNWSRHAASQRTRKRSVSRIATSCVSGREKACSVCSFWFSGFEVCLGGDGFGVSGSTRTPRLLRPPPPSGRPSPRPVSPSWASSVKRHRS